MSTDTEADIDVAPAAPGRSRRTIVIIGVLAAVVLLGLGYLAGLATPSLTSPGTNSPEAGFARDMSTHHAQAVAMSLLELENGSDPDVIGTAYAIATEQQAQIGMMAVWLQDWHLLPTGTQPPMSWMPGGPTELVNGLMPGMASVADMNKLSQARGKQEDILYCQFMLRHHLGGIHMVEGILAVTHNSRVRDLAEGMLTGQQSDVQALQSLLQKLGASPLTS
jgi:uncharacterized protein (DUF305 family)